MARNNTAFDLVRRVGRESHREIEKKLDSSLAELSALLDDVIEEQCRECEGEDDPRPSSDSEGRTVTVPAYFRDPHRSE